MSSLSELEKQIPELAAGRLSPFAAWRLRRKLRQYPELLRELSETEALYAELKTLRSETSELPAPDFGAVSTNRRPTASLTIPIFGGIAMNRRVVTAAVVALSLLCVTGGYAAVRYFYNPFQEMDAGQGLTWNAQHDFSGEVKFYGADGSYRGSKGTDGVPGADIKATVTVSGEAFSIQGAGSHELRSTKNGALLGIVELVPETAAQRQQFREQNVRDNGVEQQLHISYGARDGFGQCIGFFDDVPNRLTWKLSGANVIVHFVDIKTGKQVYSGTALGVDDTVRAAQRKELSPEAYAATVADTVPDVPEFTWTVGKKTETHTGYEPFLITLPNGMVLQARLTARSEQ